MRFTHPELPDAPVPRVTIDNPFSVNVSSNYPLPTGNPEVNASEIDQEKKGPITPTEHGPPCRGG